MTRRLVDVAQNVVINEEDCGTINGIDYTAIKDGDEVKVPLATRIAGHYTIERVLDPVSGELLADVNTYIDETLAEKIDKAGVEKVKIRTVLTCESKYGICVKCYGKDLARNRIVEIGEAVGTIAAQSIGQPGTQLTLRTFHTGGAAEKTTEDNHIAMNYPVFIQSVSGTHVVQENGDWLFTRKGSMVVTKLFDKFPIEKGDEIAVADNSRVRKGNVIIRRAKGDVTAKDNGRILIHDDTVYLVSNDQKIEIANGSVIYAAYANGKCVADTNIVDRKSKEIWVGEYDQFNEPIIAEVSGYVHYEDIIPGVTLDEHTDPQTKAVERRISDLHLDVKLPRIIISDEAGNELGSYHLPAGAILSNELEENMQVNAGFTLAKLAKAAVKANDITLGLRAYPNCSKPESPRTRRLLPRLPVP